MTVGEHPLNRPWDGPFGGLPPFDRADPAAIEMAYRAAVDEVRAAVALIAGNEDAATFENSVAALEDARRPLRRIETIYRVFTTTAMSDAMAGVQQRLAPLAPRLEDEIAHNDALFARIAAVVEEPGLTARQRRLAETEHERMRRRGAGLSVERRERLGEINSALAELAARFQQNLLADNDALIVPVENADDLDGLPLVVVAALEQVARQHETPHRWVVPNSRSMFDTVMAAARSRDLRERVWRMWTARGNDKNPPIATEMLRLRGEKARLLGFAHFADYATADRMAGNAATALALEARIWERALPAARAQSALLAELAAADGIAGPLEPWDRPYYTERWRLEHFGFDDGSLRPYLPLPAMIEAMMWAAGRLYGMAFARIETAVLHPDIRVYRVDRDGATIGLLWLDLYVRPGKRGTAWMDEYRTAEAFRDPVPALVSVNHCIQPPPPGEPVLLSWDNARVLFHEMGHAIHALLTDVDYPSLGIMAAAWDMIELPSQIFEDMIFQPDMLRRFARHNESGAPIPDALIEGIRMAATFDPGGRILEQTASALVDLHLHIAADGREIDPLAAEQAILADIDMPREFSPRHLVPHFAHIFGGEAYAAGYYAYQWAEAMVADAAAIFAAAPGGAFDRPTADRFRTALLSVGNAVPADQAWRDFAGRDLAPDALMRKLGLAD